MAEKKNIRNRKKGEEGYWERNPAAGTEAAKDVCRTFKTPEEFTAAADAYFDQCDRDGVLYGEAGLCLALSKAAGKPVTMATLRTWYDGDRNTDIQDAVQMAYMRIQNQIETDPRYQEKGMVTRGIFLNKQIRFGGYQDKTEIRNETKVEIGFGSNMDASDFK